MQLILDRYRTAGLNPTDQKPAIASSDVRYQWVEQLQDDGLWLDLDMASQDRARFPAGNHLSRVSRLYDAHAIDGQHKWKAAAELALRAFVKAKPRSSNWWWNEIGMPMSAVKILVVTDDQLPPDLYQAMLDVVGQPLNRETNARGTFTGTNLLWRCRIALLKSCVLGDKQAVADAANQAKSVIVITTGEGIQIDGSFYQHGPQLYSHGYGRAFTVDVATLAMLLADTPWALEKPQLDAMAKHCLDGQQWMMRNGYLDYHPTGRELSRPTAVAATRYIKPAELLAIADSQRSKDYQLWAQRIAGDAPPLTGSRYYWRSDYLVHQRDNFYFSVRMVSDRTQIAECVNRENILGGALSAGATCLMLTGKEYVSIFPFWDWTKLPGATTDSQVNIQGRTFRVKGKTDFVGGVSDGRYAVAAMDYSRNLDTPLHAKKTYFAFDEGVVCLGVEITSETHPLYTGVAQCRLNGQVTVDGKAVVAGEHKLDNAAVVTHGGVRYEFAPGQQVNMNFGRRTGSWHTINRSQSKAPLEGRIFGLWIEHTKPTDLYAYTILPRHDNQSHNPLKILRNDGGIQAAMHQDRSIVQAVFYKAGTLDIPGVMTLHVDQPCVVIVNDRPAQRHVTVADPTQALPSISLTLDNWKRLIELPQGQMAGSSVTQPW